MSDQLGSEYQQSKLQGQSTASRGQGYYEILDVSTNASRLQIREAYIRLRSTYSAGSHALYSLVSDEEAREALDQIEEAYRVLDDETQRREYDRSIGLRNPAVRQGGAELASIYGMSDTLNEAPQRVAATGCHGIFPEDLIKPVNSWLDDSQETVHRAPRNAIGFGKIKKAAARVNDPDVQQAVRDLMDRPQSFDGRSLMQLREIVGIPQSEVQERTKISIEYIKGLENNDFHKLPSLVYVRGFLKIYLQYLGLANNGALIESYTEKYNNWRDSSKPHSS